MPILITDSSLNRGHKKAVRESFELIISEFSGQLLESEAELIYKKICLIENSNQQLVKSLSDYLFAIYQFLDLPNQTQFHLLSEKRLIAALIYFSQIDDVIPDTIAYIGYLDDAYCVNHALSKQSIYINQKIDHIVDALKVLRRK